MNHDIICGEALFKQRDMASSTAGAGGVRLSRIEFNGYRRFVHASCNVDGRTIAFIGPNESGKSSVLQGLNWLTSPEDVELANRDLNRQEPPSPQTLVARAFYRIDDDDIAVLTDLDLDVAPPVSRSTVTEFRISRTKDGSIRTGIETSVRRSPKPFETAKRKLLAVRKTLAAVPSTVELGITVGFIDLALDEVDPDQEPWEDDRRQRVRETLDTLRSLQAAESELSAHSSRKLERFFIAVDGTIPALELALAAAERNDPIDALHHALLQRVPNFIAFSDNDRDIAESYALNDPALRADPPAPLRNLLAVANTSVREIWKAHSANDTAI